MEKILEWDRIAFLIGNQCRTEILDFWMVIFTQPKPWFPLYGIILFFIFKHFKIKGLYILIWLVFSIALADQICSSLLKPWVARLRPCHDPNLKSWIVVLGNCGGKYGFCSSHAANSFALATFFKYLFYEKYKRGAILLLCWAFLVSYSRIYVGVHYPLDIFCGAIIGILSSTLGFYILKKKFMVF